MDPRAVQHGLADLSRSMHEWRAVQEAALAGLGPDARASAANLIDYLALRSRDIRELQHALAGLGLSSLGRSESCVRWTMDRVTLALAALLGETPLRHEDSLAPVSPVHAKQLLHDRTNTLLGPAPADRDVRIMVTMPSQAADDPIIIRDLLAAGMDVMRINCAHDTPERWAAMITHLKRARDEQRRACPVLMDLGGPKARTGALRPGPQVVRWNAPRDAIGRLIRPAVVRLVARMPAPTEPMPAGVDAAMPLPEDFLSSLRPDDVLEFRDARGHARSLVAQVGREGCVLAHAERSAFVVPGTEIHRVRDAARCTLGPLPPADDPPIVQEGDRVALRAGPEPGGIGGTDARGMPVAASVPFTLPEAFPQVRSGQRILLDDGKIEGLIEHAHDQGLTLRVTRTRPGGAKLGADKGVNFPDTRLHLPTLTDRDRQDLRAIAAHADLVGLSFVHEPADVEALDRELRALTNRTLGVVLKIETNAAFENLPALLLAALRLPAAGVMIARGDLGVECGYERLAEVQEEILWLCEAAHLPAIWATQVLESLAKKGQPSRSEVTDAAMGERAECVMLNKGPYAVHAVRMLDDILKRMSMHQDKKRAMMRPLGVAQRFGAGR